MEYYTKTTLLKLEKGIEFKKYKIETIYNYSTNIAFVQCYDEIFCQYCYFIFVFKNVWYYKKLNVSDSFFKEVKKISNEELMDIE